MMAIFRTPRLARFLLNLYPPYLGAGVRIVAIAPDWSALQVQMKLTWYNRNLVGTQFGGSLYSMIDPHLMLLLMQRLGHDYIVWDQSACIDFRHPGKGTVQALIRLDDDAVASIRAETGNGQPHRPEFTVDITDDSGEIVAQVRKILYIRRKTGIVAAE